MTPLLAAPQKMKVPPQNTKPHKRNKKPSKTMDRGQ